MKKAITGSLLSGLVFPGFGQVYLGKKGAGLALILSTNIGLAGVVLSIVLRLPLIMEKIQPELEKGPQSFEQLLEISVRYAGVGGGSLLEIISLTIMAASWIFAVGHAFLSGRKLETSASKSG